MKSYFEDFSCFQVFKKTPTFLISFIAVIVLFFWSLDKTQAQFITQWKTTDGEITIPTNTSTGSYNYNITWTNQTNAGQGDGSIASQTGDYTISGLNNDDVYQIEITGTFPHFFMGIDNPEAVKLQSIEQWGSNNWLSMERAFEGCENMTYNASAPPNLTSVTSLHRTFADCFSFNGNINNWLASSNPNLVNDIHEIFAGATSFNQPLDMWVVTNVANTSGMFDGAISFNQPLDMWDVTNVTTMSAMFRDAIAFNQPLNGWGTKTGNVRDMEMMFTGASSFNQPLDMWDVINVDNNTGGMRGMFAEATSFNQPLNDWDVDNVIIMNNMFAFSAFNQPLDMWNVANVEDMAGMFANTPFNQDISSWNVSSVQDMNLMFSGATAFNNGGNALTWNTGMGTANVIDMLGMFTGATAFNQPLDTWNVSNVQDMTGMFESASSFDQSLGTWDIRNVLSLDFMLDNSGLSIESYDNTLAGWAALSPLQPSLNLDATGLQHCGNGVTAKNILENTYSWVINDAGISTDCPQISTTSINNGSTADAGNAVVNSAGNLSVPIENTGNSNLVLDNINTTGDFTYIGSDPLIIPSNTSQAVDLQIPTTTLGVKTGSLSFTSNDPNFTTFNIQLTAAVTVQPPSNAMGIAEEKLVGCSWDDNATLEIAYEVQMALNSDNEDDFTRVGILSPDITNLKIDASISNLTHVFRVRALGPDSIPSDWANNFAIAIPTDFALGLDEANQSGVLNIYPNPVKDILQINIEGQKEVNIQVYDLQGQLLDEKMINHSSEWNMKNYPTGQYIFLFQVGEALYQEKVLKK